MRPVCRTAATVAVAWRVSEGSFARSLHAYCLCDDVVDFHDDGWLCKGRDAVYVAMPLRGEE